MAPKKSKIPLMDEEDCVPDTTCSSGAFSEEQCYQRAVDPSKVLPRPENILKLIKDFTGKHEDWQHWKTRMYSIFSIYNIDIFLKAAEHVPATEWDASLMKEHGILAYIFNVLILVLDPESQLLVRHGCDQNGMLAWKILCERFDGTLETRALDLRMKLQNCRWKRDHGMSVHGYIANVQNLCVELSFLGGNISQSEQIAYLLRGLPRGPEYANFIAMERIQPSKKVDETRMRLVEFARQLEAVRARPRPGLPGNLKVNLTTEEEVLAIMNNRQCWVCAKPGHMARECPVRLKAHESASIAISVDIAEAAGSQVGEDTDSQGEDFGYISCHVYESLLHVNCSSTHDWIIDSGATTHMTNNKEWLQNAKPVQVQLGTADGRSTSFFATLRGDVQLKTKEASGKTVNLLVRDVLFAEGLTANIMSVGTLKQRSWITDFDKDLLIAPNQQVCRIVWENRLPYLRTEQTAALKIDDGASVRLSTASASTASVREHVSVATEESTMELHRQYGHAGISALRKLHPENVPKDLAILNCPSCHMGKSSQRPFPQEAEFRSIKPLQLVHSDIAGPFPESVNHKKYLIAFVDDYSRFSDVLSLENRKSIDVSVQKYIQKYGAPRVLRADNEYISGDLKNLGRSTGMKIERTAPYCPQQNGVAERLWGILGDKVRSMLHWSGIPHDFWCYAYIYAARVRNMIPTRANANHSPPAELFFAEQGEHTALPAPPPTWGCLAYVHIPKQLQQSKLDVRATPTVFIGWSRVRKAGKYFVPAQGKMVYSRSATHMLNTPGWAAARNLECQGQEEQDEGVAVHGSASDLEDTEGEGEAEVASDEEEQATTRRSSRLRTLPRVNYEEPAAPSIPGVILAKANLPEENLDTFEYLYKEKSEEDMSWSEVMGLPDAHVWKAAVRKELLELQQLEVFKVCNLPSGRKCVKHKWVFRRKRLADGKVERYKARIVAKGYSQIQGVDYNEVFASVIRPESVKLLLAIAQLKQLKVYQLDIGNAYLNARLKEEVYLSIPEGFSMLVDDALVSEPLAGQVWHLLACVPGLHQSGREWQQEKGGTLLEAGFHRSQHDCNVFFNEDRNQFIGVYTDDDLVACKGDKEYSDIVTMLRKKYRVSDLGIANFFLGVEVSCSEGCIKLTQTKYLARLLEAEGFTDCKATATPMEAGLRPEDVVASPLLDDSSKYRSLVGALLYAARWTRPDIAFAVSFCGRFCSKPTEAAMTGVKRILRYLKGTLTKGLRFPTTTNKLYGYCDSDFAADATDRRSVNGFAFFLGNCIISWMSKKQALVATSTTEAEYISLFVASQEAMFLRGIVGELLNETEQTVEISCDNNGAVALAKNPVFHKRSKHIDVKYHAIRERVHEKFILVKRVDTHDNVADCFTKPLDGSTFRRHVDAIMVD